MSLSDPLVSVNETMLDSGKDPIYHEQIVLMHLVLRHETVSYVNESLSSANTVGVSEIVI